MTPLSRRPVYAIMPAVALVVLLRGVNVGGHRTFRPSELAAQLAHLDAVNIGAAGTLVIRRAISPAQLRAELARKLPFATEVAICQGREILRMMSKDPYAGEPVRPDVVRFVSALTSRPRSTPAIPMSLPARGKWLLKILSTDGRFVFGLYRRQMKAIGHLGSLDKLFGVPVTTRNWNTMTAIARALGHEAQPTSAARSGTASRRPSDPSAPGRGARGKPRARVRPAGTRSAR
jgi:uncharacterized protein (DUF1697 family)